MKNTKEKIQLIITGILGIVLILMSAKTFGQMRSKGAQRSGPGIVVQPLAADPAVPLYAALAEEAAKLSVERDPFFPVPKAAASSIVLNGILWDENKPTAIINNEIVQVGQSVNGKVIVRIRKDRIILSDGSKEFELKMYEE